MSLLDELKQRRKETRHRLDQISSEESKLEDLIDDLDEAIEAIEARDDADNAVEIEDESVIGETAQQEQKIAIAIRAQGIMKRFVVEVQPEVGAVEFHGFDAYPAAENFFDEEANSLRPRRVILRDLNSTNGALAISATPSSDKGEGTGALLVREPEPVATEVRNQAEQDAALKSDDDWHDANATSLEAERNSWAEEDRADFDRGYANGLAGTEGDGEEPNAYHEGWGLGDHTRVMNLVAAERAAVARGTTEQEPEVLDATDVAEVLRENVPPDAILSTHADGKLYASFGGSTYLVIDSPAQAGAIAEAKPAEVYAQKHDAHPDVEFWTAVKTGKLVDA